MKKKILFPLLFSALMLFGQDVFAQSAPAPPDSHGGGSNVTATQSGGGAPIGSGLFVLLGLAGLYGGTKAYQHFKKQKEA
ncbi:MAG: hypothetical protein JXR65_06155 [Bacteroidales bacterium]|nr:hypothetical protein [Bacteroidales bacterium]